MTSESESPPKRHRTIRIDSDLDEAVTKWASLKRRNYSNALNLLLEKALMNEGMLK